MSIDIACPSCGRLIYAPEQWAGKDMVCPGCARPVRVVDSDEDPASGELPVQLACPNCDAPVRVVPKLVGRRVFCNACRAALLVSLTLEKSEDFSPSLLERGVRSPGRTGQEGPNDTMVRANSKTGCPDSTPHRLAPTFSSTYTGISTFNSAAAR